MPSKNSPGSRKPVLKAPARKAKPTVIRGHVKPRKTSVLTSQMPTEKRALKQTEQIALENVASEETKLKNTKADKFSNVRKTLVLALSGALVFGIGVKVGDQTNSSEIDDALSLIINSSAKDLDKEVLIRAAIEGALKASGDEWANYFPKSALEVLEEQNSNIFTGLGIWLSKTRGGQVQIASIQENSPAATSELKSGDQLLEVNGTDVRGASLTSVTDRKSTRLNSSHIPLSRMPSSA